jgi:hypothetical protein
MYNAFLHKARELFHINSLAQHLLEFKLINLKINLGKHTLLVRAHDVIAIYQFDR